MEFRTQVSIPHADRNISHRDNIMMFGSCFAESIGSKLIAAKFNININPFGILYNPSSICRALQRLIARKEFSEEELLFHNGMYQSLWHHGRFSDTDKQQCLRNINDSFSKACNDLRDTNTLIITFGTSYVFRHKEQDQIVANCHKFPASDFYRFRLSVDQIVTDWTTLLNDILSVNPEVKIIFTVSPIRHLKDGAHDNQLSKSTLLLAVDQLCQLNSNIQYFPSYEIVMDDLRDYRFYADDMVHPSQIAVDYIWNCFSESFFSAETFRIISEWIKIAAALNHKPFNPIGQQYKHFLSLTLSKLESFNRKYPYLCCKKEIYSLKEKLEL